MRAKKYCSRDCAFLYRKGQNHFAWKGPSATYSAIHKWMTGNFGKPSECFECRGSSPRVEWANISGKYKRERTDWISLCSSCHRYFDRNQSRRKVIIARWEKFTGKKAELLNG